MNIYIVDRQKKWRSYSVFIKKWMRLLLIEVKKQKKHSSELDKMVGVIFVDKGEMKKLNLKFRKKNKPTDILSFEGIDASELGELVICTEVIKSQAKEHGLKIREELGYMLIHGYLHLLGYDHEKSPRQAKAMFKWQDEIFETLLHKM